MGIPLRQGRFFGDQDRLGSEGVVVIDEVMAREAFRGEEPIGKHLWIGMGSDPVRVVGVVRHVRYWGLASDDQAKVRAQLYYPFAQVPDQFVRRWSELMSIAVRTSIDPLSVVEPLRRAVRGAGNDQVIYEVNTHGAAGRAIRWRGNVSPAVVRRFRGAGFAAGVDRDLRRAGLFDQPEGSGDRRADGAGSAGRGM